MLIAFNLCLAVKHAVFYGQQIHGRCIVTVLIMTYLSVFIITAAYGAVLQLFEHSCFAALLLMPVGIETIFAIFQWYFFAVVLHACVKMSQQNFESRATPRLSLTERNFIKMVGICMSIYSRTWKISESKE